MFLRTRWAMGAAEWMSGGHNSKQNDKEVFGYLDEEWNYIWATMLEDGALAVPNVKDDFGNNIKDNLVPEMFLKYIAHDLKCHIIVFDLLLGQVQFCSANHVKDNNASFDSPILLYSTGGHFQSVFPKDQEFFANYARELEDINNVTPSLSNQELEPRSDEKIPKVFNSKRLRSEPPLTTETEVPYQTTKRSVHSPANSQRNRKRKPAAQQDEPKMEMSNMFESLSSEDETEPKEDSKHLKKRKSENENEVSMAEKDGITDNVRERERARKKTLRENQSEEEKAQIKERDRLRKKAARAAKSAEDKARIQADDRTRKKAEKQAHSKEDKDRGRTDNTLNKKAARKAQSAEDKARIKADEITRKKVVRQALSEEDTARGRTDNAIRMKLMRQAQSEEEKARSRKDNSTWKRIARENMTDEEKKLYNIKGAEKKRESRRLENEAQSYARKSKNRDRMRLRRTNRSEMQRILKFQESVR